MEIMKKVLAVFLATIMALGVMSVSVFAEDELGDVTDGVVDGEVEGGENEEDETEGDETEGDDVIVVEGEAIPFVGITVEAPIAGYNADCIYDFDSEEYELVDLMWSDARTGEVLYSTNADTEVVDKAFEEGSVYKVTLALYAADGYIFEAEDLIVSINGYVAEVEEITEAGKVLVVSCDFECSGEDIDIGGGDTGSNITFESILGLLKSVLFTFIRFIGSLFGIG